MKGGAGVEDIFESLFGLAVVIFGLYYNHKKKKKKQAEKQKPVKPAMPAEAFEKPEETAAPAMDIEPALTKAAKMAKQIALEEILEIKDEDDEDEEERHILEGAVIPELPVQAPASNIPVHPGFAAIAAAAEGDCFHPEHEPMPRHEIPAKIEPVRPAAREEKPAEPIKVQRRFDSAAMRKAVITAEILNRPVALRRR